MLKEIKDNHTSLICLSGGSKLKKNKYEKPQAGTGQVVQLVMCLLHKHEDLV